MNAIAPSPGPVAADMTAPRNKEFVLPHPLACPPGGTVTMMIWTGRLGALAVIDHLVSFLASPDASWLDYRAKHYLLMAESASFRRTTPGSAMHGPRLRTCGLLALLRPGQWGVVGGWALSREMRPSGFYRP